MNKDFLKKLKHYLKYLKKKDRLNILEKYKKINYTTLDPIEEANKIYKEYNINIRITSNIKFLDSVSFILKKLKDKDTMGDIILFIIKLLLLVIIIKIPFIYVRDIISTILNDTFRNEQNYMMWALIIEFAYAFLSILIIIKQFKKKAYMLNNQESL